MAKDEEEEASQVPARRELQVAGLGGSVEGVVCGDVEGEWCGDGKGGDGKRCGLLEGALGKLCGDMEDVEGMGSGDGEGVGSEEGVHGKEGSSRVTAAVQDANNLGAGTSADTEDGERFPSMDTVWPCPSMVLSAMLTPTSCVDLLTSPTAWVISTP